MRKSLLFWLLVTLTQATLRGGDPVSQAQANAPDVQCVPEPESFTAKVTPSPDLAVSGSLCFASDSAPAAPFEAKPYVHRLQVGEWFGSGTYIGKGVFITCGHLFKDNPSFVIKIDGTQYGGRICTLYDVDLAWIEMKGIPADWPVAKARIMDIPDGIEVQCYGMESGEHMAKVDRSTVFDNGSVWVETLKNGDGVIPGDSGGGAFDAEGNLIGVIVADAIKSDHIILRPLSLEKNRFPKHPSILQGSPTMLESLMQGAGVKVALFTASWCGPCGQVKQAILPEIEKAGYKVILVDIDKEHDLAVQYDIMSIPTWVILKDGEERGRESHGSVESLLQKARSL